ncbi:MAG: UDP-galactopyranose mutase [Vampirovibrionales bacterium]
MHPTTPTIHVKNIVVGAGYSGAVIAERLASQLNEPVLVLDKKPHIAGNSYDYKDENGIHIHKYGSHIFHTQSDEVWAYLRQFTQFNTYMHTVIAVIDGIETTIPFNFNTLHDVFPAQLANRLEAKLLEQFRYNSRVPILEFKKLNDPDLEFLADYIYEKVFLHYTTKQWGVKPDEVDGSVTARVPVLISRDSRYFQDKYQGIPTQGYTQLIANMLNHPNITVQLETDWHAVQASYTYERLFYTGPIDAYFNYEFGQLPYRSIYFETETLDQEFYQAGAVVNYPNNYDFTRIHEYKHYLGDKSPKTVIAREYSEPFVLGKNDPYYPIPNEANAALFKAYADKAKQLEHVYFLGRLADYKYYDMDKAVARALKVFKGLL